jgi:hypothetical protein
MGLPANAPPLAEPVPFPLKPTVLEAMVDEQSKPVLDSESNGDALFQPIAVAWPAANNTAVSDVLKFSRIDEGVFLLPHGERPPKKDS